MRKNNKLLAVTLAALLFLAAVPLRNFVLAEEDTPGNDIVSSVSGGDEGTGGEVPPSEEVTREAGDLFVDRITLLESDGDPITGEVSFAKRYRLRYDMISPLQIKLNPTDVCMPPYLEKGKEYLLPAITDDFIGFTGVIAVKATDDKGNIITVATVSIGEDGIPVLSVTDDLDKGSLLGGYFEIEVSLNQEKIGDSEDYTFVFPKGGSLEAEIAENKKLPPAVSKEAAEYDPDDHIITWRIIIQNAANPNESLYPLTLSDVIGEGQRYVEDSFRVTEPFDSMPEEFTVSGSQLIWQCSDRTGNATIVYEYETEVDVLELAGNSITNADISVTAQNTISAAGADGSRLVDDLPAVRTITEDAPVSSVKGGGKVVHYDEENDTAEIEWTITITNNSYDIKDLTVYDYFEARGASVHLKEPPVCEPLPAVNGSGYDESGGIQNGRQYSWSYHIGDVSGNITYTITYTTVIEDYSEYLKKNNGTKPKNTAWYEFQYPLGEGELQKEFYGPAISREAEDIGANIIEKTGSYDPSTHRISWTIIVNPNRIELPDARITDRIPSGQKYVSSAVTISDNAAVTTTVDPENNTVTFDFGKEGLSGRTAIITLVTELEESESRKWANNWSGFLQNDVTLQADGLPEAGVSDTGQAYAKSMVIDKEMGSFDYASQTIPVTITINQNNMNLTGVTVTDTLSDYGLVLVREKGIQMDGVSLREGTEEDRPSYSYDGSTLVVYPQEMLTDQAKITFTVQATDSYMHEHRWESRIDFFNKAALTSDQYGREVSAQAATDMQNRPIVKSGAIDNQTGTISYSVEFNRTLLDLPAGLVLTDTLPDGLLFKQSTVKLWIASVDSRTGAMTKTAREAAGYTARVTVSGADTVLQVSLPGGPQAYILEYDVQIVDKEKAPFVNRVEVPGYTNNQPGENSVSFSSTQVAGARLEHLIYIKVKKVDAYGNPLKGAVFALMQGDVQLLMGVTGEDGYITFAGVAADTEYTIAELQAPDGYVTSARTWTFTTGNQGGEEYALEETFVNLENAGDDQEDPGSSGEGDNGEEPGSSEEEDNREVPGGREDDPVSGNETPAPSISGNEGLTPGVSGGEPNFAETAKTPQEQPSEGAGLLPQPELSRLPKTGGFWGSGIMYLMGLALMGIGVVVLRQLKKITAWPGVLLLAVGVLLIVGTLFLNLYARWRIASEISDFEAELTLLKSKQHRDQEKADSTGMQEEAGPTDLQDGFQGNRHSETAQEFTQSETAQEFLDEDGVLAVLSIPSISCREPVKEGSNRSVLAMTLGHVEGTALPGRAGNCVIAGHRNYSYGLYFNRLNEVEPGDEITITTREGIYTYTVTETLVVKPEEVWVLEQTENTKLTLITCTPLYIGTHRLIVVAQPEFIP